MKVFVPIDDQLMERLGLTLDDLVPFDLDYQIFRPDPDEREASGTSPLGTEHTHSWLERQAEQSRCQPLLT